MHIFPELNTSQAGQQVAMQIAKEQSSAFIAGLIYELDLLDFFLLNELLHILLFPVSIAVSKDNTKKVRADDPKPTTTLKVQIQGL